MTEQRLTSLLQDLAADGDSPDLLDLAPAAWRVAGQRRRSRRLTGGAVVVAAGLVVAVALAQAPDGTGHPGKTATPIASATATQTAKAGPQLAPARSAEPGLPFLDTALPRSIDTSSAAVAAAPALTRSPVGRAVALAEATTEGPVPPPVLVIGSDGQPRRMDGVSLTWVSDSGGNQQIPLDSGSLSPDGTRAAFAQKDTVVVVDLRTGAAKRWPLPGFNEQVAWSPGSDRLLVSGDTGKNLVDVADGTAIHLPQADPSGVQAFVAGGWLELSPGSVPYVDSWWGQAFGSGRLAAASAFSSGLHVEGAATADPQVLAVFDPDHPADARLLAFDWTGRYKGCCATLGWLDESTVLLTSEGGTDPVRILAWNLATRQVTRVSELPVGSMVSVAVG